jgi:hypothetical protein
MEKRAGTMLAHLEGILNYCRMKVPMGVVKAVNGNIKVLLRRGRGYRGMTYLLLKAQRLAATANGRRRQPHDSPCADGRWLLQALFSRRETPQQI